MEFSKIGKRDVTFIREMRVGKKICDNPTASTEQNLAGLSAQSITGDTVTLSWDDDKDLITTNQFKGYHLWLKKRGDNVESPLMKTTKATTFVWTHLEPAQGYEVRVTLATNDFGESAPSQPDHFSTLASTDSEKSAIEKLEATMVST